MTLTLCGVSFLSIGQLVIHQDCFHGGVTGGGFSTGLGIGEGNINLEIPNGSAIRSGFVLIYTQTNIDSGQIKINDVEFQLSSFSLLTTSNHLLSEVSPTRVYILDITQLLTENPTFNFHVETFFHPSMPAGGVFAPYIYINYEDSSMETICSILIVNNQPTTGLSSFVLSGLNPINNNYPVGFALYTDRHSYNQNERTNVYFNDNHLGLVYGSDAVNQPWTGGVKGHFYYQNNELFGLDDDVPNNTMNETDALADVSGYIDNLSTSVSIELRQIIYPVVPTSAINSYLAYFLTYTSPCQPFNAALLTSDTTTCANIPVQLGASGGNTSGAFQAYEWLPQQNLSCYDCPNPIFTGNTTTNYTVRIRNTDSCSVVYPVRVRVLPNPSFESIEITESVCGGATGRILVTSAPLSVQNLFQINNGTPQNNGNFSNLAAGEYTITLTNEHGCSVDSTVFIGEINNVQAAFSVNPTTGTAPLDISITNQSQNATEYIWDFTDEDGNLLNQVTGHFGSAQCPVAGVYTLTLVAGNGASHCNDTSSVFIVVKEPFVVFAYTHVTNEANLYQVFFSGISEYDYKIYALDGKLVYKKSGNVEAAGHVDLWEISKFSSGMYVFRINVKDLDGNEHEVDGKLVVVR